jgi:hypothetical protein
MFLYAYTNVDVCILYTILVGDMIFARRIAI